MGKQDEFVEQVGLMELVRHYESAVPALRLLHHIPNGGHRDIRVAARLKMAGVRPGVPDLFLPCPVRLPDGTWLHGLYIELKRVGGDAPTGKQKEFIEALRAQGYRVIVAYGYKAAWRAIEDYLGVDMPFEFIAAPVARVASLRT